MMVISQVLVGIVTLNDDSSPGLVGDPERVISKGDLAIYISKTSTPVVGGEVIKIAFDEESTKQSKTKGLLSKAKFQQASWASANGSNGEDISVLMCGEQGERVFTQLLID